LQVLKFLAAGRAKLLQRGHLFFRLRHLARVDIEFTEIFTCRLVIGLQLERLGVVGERRPVVTGLRRVNPTRLFKSA
jgi:hypothetical protein